ncbi:ABC transporter ATP-binding protein [Sulfurospirillum arcachonense]|uniref:ABC transporter ATP-binding protein n=1 Tax=Sulfurospirillum arcachonense TaxID=57666 RepID=UPI00046A27F8|nr:ABC transporter ATP-binding protein [Sulfurospirillum arcachonense]
MYKYTFKDIFKDIKKYKKELILANIIAFLAVFISTPVPLLMPLLVDEVLLNKPSFIVNNINKITNSTYEPYVYVACMLFSVIVLRCFFFLLNYYQTKIFTIISKNITFELRKSLLKQLSKVSLKEFEFMGSGNISSLLIIDVDTVDNFLGTAISRLIISVLTILGVGIVLLLIHWQLALFILLLNPFVIIITTKIARKVSVLKKEQNKTYEIFTSSLTETLDLFIQIKSLNREGRFFGEVTKNAAIMRDRTIEFGYKSDAATRFSFLIFLSGFEIFRAASILVVAYSDLTIGLMLAIFGYLWVMMTPIQEVLNMQYAYHNAVAALNRINEIFALKTEPLSKSKDNPFKDTFTNAIDISDLSFSYENGKKILKSVNMQIPKGKKIAVVGASGSGKTTLAQLLVGLYPIQDGDIYFDGHSVKDIGLDKVRENVFLVLQNPQLFNDTIAKNLTFGDKVEKDRLDYAIEIAQMRDFIYSLEDGLQTKIGRDGIKLSGGQRQRLSIARMVIQNPNIVILDESTSALDVHTESRLFDALEEYLQNKTTIIIAHRLSTIRKADYIYVLESGEIVEKGNSKDLMEQEGLFYSYVKEKENKGRK